MSNHSLHPFHNQDERISFYPLRCIDHLLLCSGQVSKVAGRQVSRVQWQQEGLCVACAFTNKRQQALLATGRRWIKNRSSKFRRKIARSCHNKSNDTYNSVSSFSLLFLLFLAGDGELNPGPAVTSSNSHSENSVLELPILVSGSPYYR